MITISLVQYARTPRSLELLVSALRDQYEHDGRLEENINRSRGWGPLKNDIQVIVIRDPKGPDKTELENAISFGHGCDSGKARELKSFEVIDATLKNWRDLAKGIIYFVPDNSYFFSLHLWSHVQAHEEYPNAVITPVLNRRRPPLVDYEGWIPKWDRFDARSCGPVGMIISADCTVYPVIERKCEVGGIIEGGFSVQDLNFENKDVVTLSEELQQLDTPWRVIPKKSLWFSELSTPRGIFVPKLEVKAKI